MQGVYTEYFCFCRYLLEGSCSFSTLVTPWTRRFDDDRSLVWFEIGLHATRFCTHKHKRWRAHAVQVFATHFSPKVRRKQRRNGQVAGRLEFDWMTFWFFTTSARRVFSFWDLLDAPSISFSGLSMCVYGRSFVIALLNNRFHSVLCSKTPPTPPLETPDFLISLPGACSQ